MQQYGQNLGVAFQIIDDVLDYAGSEATIGKPTGNDLRHGLVTLPLIYALQGEHNVQIEQLRGVLERTDSPEDAVDEVVRCALSGPPLSAARDPARHYPARGR